MLNFSSDSQQPWIITDFYFAMVGMEPRALCFLSSLCHLSHGPAQVTDFKVLLLIHHSSRMVIMVGFW
jgi:hypothetical protein